ncbi:MAG: metallophosphoesterase, partial [Bacteroidales bacterium]|nr:metallophosphoesterase [Bacteroidales bacterium]
MAQYFSKLWFIIPLAVYLLVNTYVYLHGWWALPSDNAVRIVYAAVFWVCSLSFFIGIAANKFISWRVGAVFSNIGGYWILLFCFFLIACLFADLLRLVQHFADYYPAFVKNNYPLVKQIYFGIVLLGCAGCIIKGHYNFDHTQVVTLNLETAKRQSSLDSLKIAAVSDIHLGNVVRKERLQRYVAQINALQPDIILIAGDIIDHSLGVVRTQHLEDVLPLL